MHLQITDSGCVIHDCPPLPPLNRSGEKALRIRVAIMEAEQAAADYEFDRLEDRANELASECLERQIRLRQMREILFLRGRHE